MCGIDAVPCGTLSIITPERSVTRNRDLSIEELSDDPGTDGYGTGQRPEHMAAGSMQDRDREGRGIL